MLRACSFTGGRWDADKGCSLLGSRQVILLLLKAFAVGRWNRSQCLVRSRGCSRRGRRGKRTQNSPGVGLNGTRTKRPCTPFGPKHRGGDPRTLGGDPRTPGKCRGRALWCGGFARPVLDLLRQKGPDSVGVRWEGASTRDLEWSIVSP